MASFTDRLKQLRKENNMTQKELADVLNVTQTAINYWENGKREPNTSILELIADFFGVSRAYLMGWDECVDSLQESQRLIGSLYDAMEKERLKNNNNFDQILPVYNKLIKAQMDISDSLAKNFSPEELEKILVTKEQKILSLFTQLNEAGKQKAIEDVENLTYNPKYKK